MLSVFLSLVVSQAGCAVRERRWAPREPFALRLDDGTQWGSLEKSMCTDWVGPSVQAIFDGDGGAHVSLKQWGVHVTTQALAVDVFTSMSKHFGNGFTSSGATALRMLAATDAGVVLQLAPREDFDASEAFTPAPAVCDELRLNAGEVTLKEYDLQSASTLRVLDRPGGKLIATLPKNTKLLLGPLTGDFTRVTAILADGSELTGFVRGRLRGNASRGAFSVFSSAICDRLGEPPPTECPMTLQLLATDGQHLARIGTLDSHTFFDLEEKRDVLIQLRLREQPFSMAQGWRLVAFADELASCTPAFTLQPRDTER